MDIKHQVDLSNYNTLHLPCVASRLVLLDSEEDLSEFSKLLNSLSEPLLVLGGGSNLVLPEILTRTVVGVKDDRIQVFKTTDDAVYLNVGAGCNWDNLVKYSVEQGWGGLENLSLIPGTVGAAPVQNIGAYGVELKDVFESLRVYDIEQECLTTFTNKDCQFNYRDSVFKQKSGRYLILSVLVRLQKTPEFKLDYGELKGLEEDPDLSLSKVRNEVIRVRQAKLPDPDKLPNAGSFFKNPVVPEALLGRIENAYPDVVYYQTGTDKFKLAAGWLIDNAGFKGYKLESVGVHDRQALVLVNHCDGKQRDILELATLIQDKIYKLYGVRLEIEPVVISSS